MSNVTIRESGSKSGVGSCGLTISASGRVADCSQRSLALYGSPSKYICVTRRFKRPVTSKWMCAGRMMFAVYRIGTRLDGDEPIAAIGIRGQFGKAIEIRVERRGVPVTRMAISPE